MDRVSQRESAVKEKSSNGVLREVNIVVERTESPPDVVAGAKAKTPSEVVWLERLKQPRLR
jgi:hypothetical protein